MIMREGESVKAYVERYWEMFNEINGNFDEVAVRTFKIGLPSEHGLRKSLTGKDRKSTRLNSSHPVSSRMPSSA